MWSCPPGHRLLRCGASPSPPSRVPLLSWWLVHGGHSSGLAGGGPAAEVGLGHTSGGVRGSGRSFSLSIVDHFSDFL